MPTGALFQLASVVAGEGGVLGLLLGIAISPPSNDGLAQTSFAFTAATVVSALDLDQDEAGRSANTGRMDIDERSATALKPSWSLNEETQIAIRLGLLVLLFYCILLMPFEVRIGGTIVPLPGWAKSTAGLALPVMANVAELVGGALQSIPSGQWEAAEALAFTRLQTLRLVILPQCLKRMTPPWMNLYAIVVVATPLTSIVGVSEAMTLTRDVLSAEGRTELLVPLYLYLLTWFFIYCYPIARATVALERRLQVS